MKKIKYLLISLFAILVLPLHVWAASGTIKVTGTSSAVIGNTVTITVTLSSGTSIGSWDMDLKYDKSYLQLISTNSEGGGVSMVNSSSGTKSKSYTFKFKALKKGTTTVSMSSYSAYAYDDMSEMSLSAGSKSIKIMTQAELEASYSKDNNLNSISVEGYEITPEFNKDTLEYSVVVPEDTKEIEITAKASDSRSSISGTGTKEVTSGTNTFPIVVRAENGAEKTYTLTVEVKDSNPINVTVDNEDYTVIKIKEYMPTSSYQETTVKIGEFDIPAYYNETIDKTLVGLKNSVGESALFIYEEGKYFEYTEFKFNEVLLYLLETDKTLDNFKHGSVDLLGSKVNAYYLDDSSRFIYVYGVNLNTGEEGFFKVDKTSGSAIYYDEEELNVINDYKQKNTLYSCIIIGFSVILIIMFILLLNKKRNKNSKKDKKVKIEEIKENEKDSEIVEITNDKEVKIYDDPDKQPKKKKKSKK